MMIFLLTWFAFLLCFFFWVFHARTDVQRSHYEKSFPFFSHFSFSFFFFIILFTFEQSPIDGKLCNESSSPHYRIENRFSSDFTWWRRERQSFHVNRLFSCHDISLFLTLSMRFYEIFCVIWVESNQIKGRSFIHINQGHQTETVGHSTIRCGFLLTLIFNSFLTLPKLKQQPKSCTKIFMGKSRELKSNQVWRPRNLLPTARDFRKEEIELKIRNYIHFI